MPNTQVDEVLAEHVLGHIRVATVFVIHVFAQPVKDDDEFAFALEEMWMPQGIQRRILRVEHPGFAIPFLALLSVGEWRVRGLLDQGRGAEHVAG